MYAELDHTGPASCDPRFSFQTPEKNQQADLRSKRLDILFECQRAYPNLLEVWRFHVWAIFLKDILLGQLSPNRTPVQVFLGKLSPNRNPVSHGFFLGGKRVFQREKKDVGGASHVAGMAQNLGDRLKGFSAKVGSEAELEDGGP